MGCVGGTLVRLERVCTELHRIEAVSAQAKRIEQADGTVRRVCGTGTLFYLRVTPAEPQWLGPDGPLVYQVESNTAWEIL